MKVQMSWSGHFMKVTDIMHMSSEHKQVEMIFLSGLLSG